MHGRIRRTRARGRRVILWMAAICLGGQVGMSLWLDRYGTRIRFPELVHVLRTAENQPPPSVCFLGSSRSQSAVKAEVMTKIVRAGSGDASFGAFCGALPAGDPIAQARVLDELLRHERRPKIAVIEVAPEFVIRINRRMPEHVRRQVGWADVLAYLPDTWRAHNLPRLATALLMPCHMHRLHLLREMARLWDEGWDRWRADYELTAPGRHELDCPCDAPTPAENARLLAQALGTARPAVPPAPAVPLANPRAGSERLQGGARNPALQQGAQWVAGWLRNYQIGGKSAECLEGMLDRCRAQGIVPILLETPVAAAHRALYTPEIETAYRGYVRGLCARYGSVFIDARAWCSDDCMRDNHHMTPAGAQVFTERFAREVLLPVWTAYRGFTSAAEGPALPR